MFNYYTYEKLIKEYLKKESEQEKEVKQQFARQNQNNQLIVNYNRRINKFVLEMVKSPLQIRDYSIQAKNTRKELMEKIPEEMKGKKKFVFNKFVTDRERVTAYLEEQKKNHEEYTLPIQKTNNHNISVKKDSNNDNITTATPSKMNSYTNSNSNINRLFRKSDSNLRFIHTSKSRLNNDDSHHIKLDPYTKKNNQMQLNRDVSSSFKSTNDRHIKTHFKAVTSIAEGFNSQLNIENKNLKEAINSLNHNNTMRLFSPIRKIDIQKVSRFKKGFSSKILQKMEEKRILKEKISNSPLDKIKQRFPIREENVDLIISNPLIFDLKYNNESQNQLSNSINHEDKLNYLLYLSTKDQIPKPVHNLKSNKREMGDITKKKGKNKKPSLSLREEDDDILQGNLSDYSKDDKIWYENELISLNKMNYLARKVLKNCNYVNKKSKYNDSSLKKGNGKLMITAGMSVKDFLKKYHIN